MKKVLIILGILASVTAFSEGNKVEVRVGGDIMPQFSVDGPEKDAEFSYELGVEYRREVMPNFEIGGGIAYQDHGKLQKYTQSEYGMNVESTIDLYDSVPLYLTARYNFKNATEVTPYVKASLGYSFNVNDGDQKIKISDPRTGATITDDDLLRSFDVDNGWYYAVGAGAEYKGFTVDLAYQVNTADVHGTYWDGDSAGSGNADYSRMTLGLGYNFGF